MTVAYSLGTSKFDNLPSHRQLPSLDEFFETILAGRHECTPADKAAGRVPYFAPAFAPGYDGQRRRCTECALPRAWIGLDIDLLVPAAELLLTPLLQRWRCIWYATMSAVPANLRRRVILALDREAAIPELPRVAVAVERFLTRALAGVEDGIEFDHAASTDVARLWYLPHREAAFGMTYGEPVRVDGALAVVPDVPTPPREVTALPDADLWARIAAGSEVHDAVARLAARLVGRGMDAEDAVATIEGGLDPNFAWAQDDPRRFRARVLEVRRAVTSAHRRFARDGRPAPAPEPAPLVEAFQRMSAATTQATQAMQGLAEANVMTLVEYSHDAGRDAVLRWRGDDLRYLVANKKWAYWTGQRWDMDSRMAHGTVDEVAVAMGDRARSDPALTPAQRTTVGRTVGSLQFRLGVRGVCEHEPVLCASPGDFDADPFVLNTPDALVDLRTGATIENRRDRLVSKMARCSPVLDRHEGSRFAAFLREITGGNFETESFLQRALGACLLGKGVTADAWLLFMIGSGRNGKSVLMEAVSHAMGTYAGKVPSSTLLSQDNNNERHPTEIAYLRGLRLGYAAEIDEGKRWNESRIKELTGDRRVTARVMRGDPFEFDLTHHFVIAANHRPALSNPDPALRARLRMVPFLQCFTGNEEPGLYEKLRDEAPIVLGWLLRGARIFLARNRLDGCPQSDAETEDYFDAHSTLEMWIGERCTIDEFAVTSAKDLYADFRRWKETRGEGIHGLGRFMEQLNRDTRFTRVRGVLRGLRGVRLNELPPAPRSIYD